MEYIGGEGAPNVALWKVQAGKQGEQERAIEHDLVAIGWNELPDLSQINSIEALSELYTDIFPGKSSAHVTSVVAQIWAFKQRIRIGDLVIVPRKCRTIAIGIVTSDYRFRNDMGEDIRHTRHAKWLAKDMARGSFDQDLLYSFRAAMTVCQVSRNEAEKRIRVMFNLRQN